MLSSDYIIGLVDGEGSFQVQTRKGRKNPTLRFSIKLIEKDKDILEQVKSQLDCGKIYIQNDSRPNHSRCFRFEVFNQKEIIEKIIPFFEKNPPKIKSKINDFEIFKRVSRELSQPNRDDDLINTLIKQMH